VCSPAGKGVKIHGEDLFSTPLDQAEIDFENVGGETYICGNPPYKGSQDQTAEQKRDLELAFHGRIKSTKSADYVSGWFIRGRDYVSAVPSKFAFVATNSVNQGRQVALYWPTILGNDLEIFFAVPSFPWSNLAAKAAVVTVSIVGVSRRSTSPKRLYYADTVKSVAYIGPYLVPDQDVIVESRRRPLSQLGVTDFGSMPNDGGYLLLSATEGEKLLAEAPEAHPFLKKFVGSDDALYGKFRYCLWITDDSASAAQAIGSIAERIEKVRKYRLDSDRETTKKLADRPYAFGEIRHKDAVSLLIPRHSSEDRRYLPFDLVGSGIIVADSAIALPNARLFEAALFGSRMHLTWIATVCGKLETRYRYSNTLGWNTFPVPALTEQNKADLSRCAEDILLAREAHFPATIADLYDPETMPANLREAHERNDETLERIYIGRRFKNDTERLEKLFELYTKMIARQVAPKRRATRNTRRTDDV
jgi:MmeI, target recognition domain/MmeI, DNA-methyltransferase domain/MmeI, C-terminal domain